MTVSEASPTPLPRDRTNETARDFATMLPARTTLLITGLLTLYAAIPVSAQQRADTTLFRLVPTEESNLRFANMLVESDTFYMGSFIYAYNGGGVAIGDVDGDDLPDIYIVGTQSHAPSRLYRNLGSLRFEDVSAASGLLDSTGIRFGVAMVDIDGDGDLDIHVARQDAPNRMYINDGKGRFSDRAAELGLDHCCSSTRGLFLDYDRDGDLDLYLGINGDAHQDQPMVRGLTDRLYRNDDGQFVEVTEEAGIYDLGYCLSVSVGDYDSDGWPDIYVTNDFQERDLLYMNNGDGTFTDRMKERMRHTSTSSMGSDVGDLDGDGDLDIIAVDMVPEDHARKFSNQIMLSTYSPVFDSTQLMRNTMQLNRGAGYFSDVAQMVGLPDTDWSWGPLIADYDNDGDADLYITNGFKRDVLNLDIIEYVNLQTSPMAIMRRVPLLRLKNYVYRNDGDLRFTKSANAWGLDQVVNSNGVARGDLDGDGDLDLVLNNLDSTMMLLENRASNRDDAPGYFRVRLEGAAKNRGAIGARVTITTAAGTQMREMTPARSYLSSVEPILHFGLGRIEGVERIEVSWPDGSIETFDDGWSANQVVALEQGKGRTGEREGPDKATLAEIPLEEGLAYRHKENVHRDFYRERLLPRRYSTMGPGMAAGDLDGDGADEIWIGGAVELPGTIFDGRAYNGKPIEQPALVADGDFEDQGAIFFDADGDGDLDLYVVSGGNDNVADSALFQDRLYRNDGTGRLTRDTNALPTIRSSGSAVAAADFDGDGDLDLVVGGRVVPDFYPDPPRSLLLRNDGGQFVDATASLAPALERHGMISSLIFSDVDNDNDPDIVAVGEWLAPTIFENDGGRFAPLASTGLEAYTGWWNSVVGGDFDEDGDIDYVFGNIGRNTRAELQPSMDEPIRLYANDFDGNGSRDLVMSYVRGGHELPVRSRADVAEQMKTYIKRRFPTTTRYALSPIEKIYEPSLLASSHTVTATTFESMMAENNGDGTFAMRSLPVIAQVAPIHGMVALDIDGDGHLDLAGVDNFHGPDGGAVLYDAGLGLLLLGDGDGGFRSIEPNNSGFRVGCDARSLIAVAPHPATGDNEVVTFPFTLLVGCNYDAVRMYAGPDRSMIAIDRAEGLTHAIIRFEDGRSRREEFHVGSGYLSDFPPLLLLPNKRPIEAIELYRGSERVRTISR